MHLCMPLFSELSKKSVEFGHLSRFSGTEEDRGPMFVGILQVHMSIGGLSVTIQVSRSGIDGTSANPFPLF